MDKCLVYLTYSARVNLVMLVWWIYNFYKAEQCHILFQQEFPESTCQDHSKTGIFGVVPLKNKALINFSYAKVGQLLRILLITSAVWTWSPEFTELGIKWSK